MSRWHRGSSPETSLSWRGHGAAPVTVEKPQESSGVLAKEAGPPLVPPPGTCPLERRARGAP